MGSGRECGSSQRSAREKRNEQHEQRVDATAEAWCQALIYGDTGPAVLVLAVKGLQGAMVRRDRY
jgi:hypothetical protein